MYRIKFIAGTKMLYDFISNLDIAVLGSNKHSH